MALTSQPMSASLIGCHCQAPYFLAFVVSTAWVTLLYVVGLAIGAASIGRIGRESLAFGRAADVHQGSEAAENTAPNFRLLYLQQQT